MPAFEDEFGNKANMSEGLPADSKNYQRLPSDYRQVLNFSVPKKSKEELFKIQKRLEKEEKLKKIKENILANKKQNVETPVDDNGVFIKGVDNPNLNLTTYLKAPPEDGISLVGLDVSKNLSPLHGVNFKDNYTKKEGGLY